MRPIKPHRSGKGLGLFKNIAVIFVMTAAAAGLLIYGFASKAGKTSAGRMRVLVNGEVFTEREIRDGERITVSQPDGCENVIVMTEDGFYMLSANCHNQDCVRQGEVTEKNYMYRTLGTSIICIPNRVEVQLVLTDQSETPPIEYPDV